MRESVIERVFVKTVQDAGGMAYKLTSQTANGLPDRLVLFFPAKTVFVELKAPGKMLRPLQRKRRNQLMKLGFPVLCIDRFSQIGPAIEAILAWNPGEPFTEVIGARIPDLENISLPSERGSLGEMVDTADAIDTVDMADVVDMAVSAAMDDPMASSITDAMDDAMANAMDISEVICDT